MLPEWGADVNTENSAGDSPLCQAAEAGSEQVFSLLLHCGARLDRPGRLVRAAARGGNVELVRRVLDTLESGHTVDTEDTEDTESKVDTEDTEETEDTEDTEEKVENLDSVDTKESEKKTSELCLPTVALVTATAHRNKQVRGER